jgi:hypothetical protein
MKPIVASLPSVREKIRNREWHTDLYEATLSFGWSTLQAIAYQLSDGPAG